MLRSEVEKQYTWDLSKFYKNNKLWFDDYENLKKFVGKFKVFKGKLGDKQQLKKYLEINKNCSMLITKLYMYASNNLNTCLSNKTFNEMTTQLQGLSTLIAQEGSFAEPELLSYSDSYLKELQNDEDFKNNKFWFKELLRDKKHVLSEKEEKLLGGVQNFAGDCSDVFDSLADVDFVFDDALDSKGNPHEVTDAKYPVLLKDKDRTLRENAYKSFYGRYKSFNNTITLNYISNLKSDLFFAKARNYKNTFDSALTGSNIPLKLYEMLKKQVRLNLPLSKKYYGLRKKALKLDKLEYYDLRVSVSDSFDRKFTFDEAKQIVLEALKPLGEEYVNTVKRAFSERWIDVYPTKDKRSGGYEIGMYGTTPLILLNFVGVVDDVFTLAHELGHAMHTFYSNKNQPFETCDYTIFLAEIASTFNEVLLTKYFLNNAKTSQEKLFFLDKFINLFNSTIFTQMQYSEFEEFAHNLIANNLPISKEILNEEYFRLNAIYNAGVNNDDLKKYHWSIVPHFYRSFYVYKYATGLISAVTLASNVLNNKPGALKKYFKFISAGGSDYSTNILKRAGVDLTTEEPYKVAFAELKAAINQMEKLIK